jgi:hypothetical protein
MKPFVVALLALFLVGCASPKPQPRTVWINGMQVPENCVFVEEHWSKVLAAIESPNIYVHTVHTREGSISATRINNETYICNRSEWEMNARKRK